MLHIFRGTPALSNFRLNQLFSGFQQDNLPIVSCYAEFLHFAHLSEALTEIEREKLEELLRYGPTQKSQEPYGECFVVIHV